MKRSHLEVISLELSKMDRQRSQFFIIRNCKAIAFGVLLTLISVFMAVILT